MKQRNIANEEESREKEKNLYPDLTEIYIKKYLQRVSFPYGKLITLKYFSLPVLSVEKSWWQYYF